MMWVWQGGRVNSWLAGCLAGGWLVWCCCLVVETGSWCWFGVAVWWWKLEADADLVLLPGGGNWKLMLILVLLPGGGSWCWFGAAVWWWKLEANADLVLQIVGWISGAGCRSLGTGLWISRGLSRGCWGVCSPCSSLVLLICWLPSLGESPDMEWTWFVAMQIWLETAVMTKSSKGGNSVNGYRVSSWSVFSTFWFSLFTIKQKNVQIFNFQWFLMYFSDENWSKMCLT